MDDHNVEKKPLLSVIVPIFNAQNDLERELDSILGNDLQDFEVILIDDGSRDGSGAICDRYVERYPAKFRVEHTVNRGLSAARNLGISLARGRYFIIVDADDWCEPQLFSSLVDAAERSGAAAACCGVRYIDDADGTITEYGDSLLPRRLAGTTVDFRTCGAIMNGLLDCATWNKIYRRSYVAGLGLEYEVGLKFGEDNRYWADFFFSGAKISVVPGCFYNYRINQRKHTLSTLARKSYDSFAETMRVVLKTMKKYHIFEEFKGEFFAYLACQTVVAYGLLTPERKRDFFRECAAVYREAGSFRLTGQQKLPVKLLSAAAAFIFGKLPFSLARVPLSPCSMLARPGLKKMLRQLAAKAGRRGAATHKTEQQ